MKNTCRILFFEVLTLNIPRVCSPCASKCRKQTVRIFGMDGSSLELAAAGISAVEPHEMLSSNPGTLPIILSRDSKLSQDPLWKNETFCYQFFYIDFFGFN